MSFTEQAREVAMKSASDLEEAAQRIGVMRTVDATRSARWLHGVARAIRKACDREEPEKEDHSEEDFPKAREITKRVGEHFGLSLLQMLGVSHSKSIVFARQIAAFLIRDQLELSFKELGRFFGRDHTTMMTACRKGQKIWEEVLSEVEKEALE